MTDGDDKTTFTLKYIQKNRGQSGIVYAATRSNVEQICYMLKNRGIKAGMYHGGLDSITRHTTQDAFLEDKIKVMVATNAFGMGINKRDVRYIIWNMPKAWKTITRKPGVPAGMAKVPSVFFCTPKGTISSTAL